MSFCLWKSMLGFWTSGPVSFLGASDSKWVNRLHDPKLRQIVAFILFDWTHNVVQYGLFCDRGTA